MNNNEKLKKNILDKIESGEIKMHPKAYFVLKIIALVFVAILVLVTSALLLSFIFYSIQVSGRLFLLGFGLRGFGIFFLTFPWWILFIDIVFVLCLEWLLKRFQFGYRSPIVYTLGGVILLTFLAAFVIEYTPLHGSLAQQEQKNRLPIIGGFYDQIRRPPHELGVFRGVVTAVDNNIFTLRNSDRDIDTDDATTTLVLKIFLNPSVQASTLVKIGDSIIVAGDRSGSEIHVYGFQKIPALDGQ